jgi:hypothetical protein
MESASKLLCLRIINAINCSRRCMGQFQVARADSKPKNYDRMHFNRRTTLSGGKVHEKLGGRRGGQHSAGPSGESDNKAIDEEIVSPASYVLRLAWETNE